MPLKMKKPRRPRLAERIEGMQGPPRIGGRMPRGYVPPPLICEWCKDPVEADEAESTPAGSMHPDCANNYERDKPEDW